MLKSDFTSLDEEQQKDVLFNKGLVLARKVRNLFTFILFKLDGFYVEAMFDASQQRMILSRTYNTTKYLGSYLHT